MPLAIEAFLHKVQNLIFVEAYEEAFKLMEQYLSGPQGKNSTLMHFQFIELALSQKTIQYAKNFYDAQGKKSNEIFLVFIDYLNKKFFKKEIKLVKLCENFLLNLPEEKHVFVFFILGHIHESLRNFHKAKHFYNLCLDKNPYWSPAYYHLSQIALQEKNSKEAFYYLDIFEKISPQSFYGKLQIHQKVYEYWINQKCYEKAKKSIKLLSLWWLKKENFIPKHVSIYEKLSIINLEKIQKVFNPLSIESLERELSEILKDFYEYEEEELYLITSILKIFQHFHEAEQINQKLLFKPPQSKFVLDKVLEFYFEYPNVKISKKLIQEAYSKFPINEIEPIRNLLFLRDENISQEIFFSKRNQFFKIPKDDKKFLSLKFRSFEELQSIFSQDLKVLLEMANCYKWHKMYEASQALFEDAIKICPVSWKGYVDYFSMLLESKKFKEAESVFQKLEKLILDKSLEEKVNEFLKEKSKYLFFVKKDTFQASKILRSLLKNEPWNLMYLSQMIMILSFELSIFLDEPLEEFLFGRSPMIDEVSFFNETKSIFLKKKYFLALQRAYFLFILFPDFEENSRFLIRCGCFWDCENLSKDLMKLLNTNFHSLFLFYGLGQAALAKKEFKVAEFWYKLGIENIENKEDLSKVAISSHMENLSLCLLGMAELMLWIYEDFDKSFFYSDLVVKLKSQESRSATLIMVQIHIYKNEVRKAESLFKEYESYPKKVFDEEKDNQEELYVRGLLFQKLKKIDKAKSFWSRLHSQPKTLKDLWIKNKISLLTFF